jgi:hypothetical protein
MRWQSCHDHRYNLNYCDNRVMELTSQGEPITLDDPKRWKKHNMTAKERCYHMSKGEPSYRENYDRIKWKRSDEPRGN